MTMNANHMHAHRTLAVGSATAHPADMAKPETYVGKTAVLRVTNPDPRRDSGELLVEVLIVSARERFGRIDVEVTPVAGSGTQWVQLTSLERIR
jgi:hypothetical protein